MPLFSGRDQSIDGKTAACPDRRPGTRRTTEARARVRLAGGTDQARLEPGGLRAARSLERRPLPPLQRHDLQKHLEGVGRPDPYQPPCAYFWEVKENATRPFGPSWTEVMDMLRRCGLLDRYAVDDWEFLAEDGSHEPAAQAA